MDKKKILKIGLIGIIGISISAIGLFYVSDDFNREVKLAAIEQMGNVASQRMSASHSHEGDATTSVAAEFINIPIAAQEIAPGIFQATGVGNTHLITTENSHILFDTGLSLQVPKQIKALEAATEKKPLTHIIVSHSHADHLGGVKFWQRDETKIITHTDFQEEQRYLTELNPYFYGRNRLLFPFMPEKPPTLELLQYGGVRTDIAVADFETYRFEEGGRIFEVIGTPGAEGADNIVLWLPEEKILFSGDVFGPIFPQFPNVFTMRGEKIRKPVEYLKTLKLIMALDPDVIVPSHREVVRDKTFIRAGLQKMHDAVSYVHDETVNGMNAGKTLHQLMAEIKLPAELALSQEHGKVSWAVKSIWEYYATWFHFDKTSELYAVPDTAIYPDLVALSGHQALNDRIAAYLDEGKVFEAMHLLEIAQADKTNLQAWLHTQKLHKKTLSILLQQAEEGDKNSYEIYWLKSQIRLVNAVLSENNQ
ncbi:MAG: MBL fold metallo-hydrolase [Parvibaculales bacterium]